MKKVAFILAGSGHQDGTEIQEAVIAMLAFQRLGCDLYFFAPDKAQTKVQNHIKREAVQETRNVLVESGRIARGKIKALTEFDASFFDALVLPGGFGAALNLCDFAMKGSHMSVEPSVKKALVDIHAMGKPIAAICIAPVILAGVFGREKPRLTLGAPSESVNAMQALGAVHEECPVNLCVVDRAMKFVSTPAYMYDDASTSDIATGIEALAVEMIELMRK